MHEAPLYQWRSKFDNEIDFEKIRDTYLNPTDTFADRIKCSWPCSCKCFSGWRRSVEFEDGSCVAICDEYMGDDVVIDKQELLYYAAKESVLVPAVAKAMGITPYTAKLEQPENTWKVGSVNVNGDPIPVFLSLMWKDRYLLELIFNLNRMMHEKYILLGVSQNILSHSLEDLLHDGGGVFVPLNETLDFNQDAELEQMRPFSWEKLLLPPEALNEEPENIFRKCGDAWEIRYDGGEKFMLIGAETGARYIHFMLGKPGVSTPITEIMRTVSGESESVMSVDILEDGILTEGYSFGDLPDSVTDNLADDKAIRQYRQEINRLKHDIEAAESVGDNITVEQLEQDMQNLINRINKFVSPAGQNKKITDHIKKLVDSLRRSVNFAIEKIGAHDHFLASHLKEAVRHGQAPGYFPGKSINWDL